MATLPKGINLQKHFSKILNDWGRNVTINRVSNRNETSNISGDLPTSYESDEIVKVIFLKRNQKFIFDKEGIVELGDAYILVKYEGFTPLSIHDKVNVDGEVFEVDTSINRFDTYHFVTLTKID